MRLFFSRSSNAAYLSIDNKFGYANIVYSLIILLTSTIYNSNKVINNLQGKSFLQVSSILPCNRKGSGFIDQNIIHDDFWIIKT